MHLKSRSIILSFPFILALNQFLLIYYLSTIKPIVSVFQMPYFFSIKHAQEHACIIMQVGAVIVGANKVVLGIGYNGFPRCERDVMHLYIISFDFCSNCYTPVYVHAYVHACLRFLVRSSKLNWYK